MSKKLIGILIVLMHIFIPNKSVSLDYKDYLNNSLRGKIPGLTLDFDKEEQCLVTVCPYGFVQLEGHADSRQVIGTFEDLSVFYPAQILLDINGEDINAQPEFHITPRRTTFGLLLNGPDNECMSSMGAIEADFTAISLNFFEDDLVAVSSLRLRHAFAYMNWNDCAILAGQYWHPLAEPEVWPLTIDSGSAFPIEIGTRMPQIRFIKNYDQTDLMLTLASQMDFVSETFNGPTNQLIRNAFVPNINLKFTTDLDWIFFGGSFDYKRLLPNPNLQSDKAIKEDSTVDSFIGEGFIKFNFDPLYLRIKGMYVQNGSDQGALSGYAVSAIDPTTDIRTYTPTACWNVWADLMYYLEESHTHQLGIYGGYTQNLGSKIPLYIDPFTNIPFIFTLPRQSQLVEYVMKIMPRYEYVNEPIVLGLEIALSRTAYGTPNEFARIENPIPVNNVRVTLQFNYVF